MRTIYREHLDAFSRDLIEMCNNVRELMDNATIALLTQSLDHAEDALSSTDALDVIRQRCEVRSMQLLALESPVASDLRQVVSSIYIVEDFERMGALATHIAKLARLRHPHPVVPETMVALVDELVRLARELGTQTEELLSDPDPDAAVTLRDADDEVDTMTSYILNVTTNQQWEHSAREAVDLALLCRYFERYSDHCVNVAARTVFLATGMKPEAYLEHRRSGDGFDMDERFAVIEKRFDRRSRINPGHPLV
ncbi:phosphate signaling complex protein PhoU [Corynebacterium qintianiae]|uniref:Phosphate-specific transport system accessory protein PhoU n=1 Tax=Corynebacterium qintianiae TaxID=2709392 RepID=A0A7T0PFG1_9CORY|nr:phosphate signaling complex protein PhoU [Corynebacterium qintianiae]QPK82947.1 phosphate signaling complex protein PhoU [Corynebacterium qintianiae]